MRIQVPPFFSTPISLAFQFCSFGSLVMNPSPISALEINIPVPFLSLRFHARILSKNMYNYGNGTNFAVCFMRQGNHRKRWYCKEETRAFFRRGSTVRLLWKMDTCLFHNPLIGNCHAEIEPYKSYPERFYVSLREGIKKGASRSG